jgi:hypothetical protein
LSSACLAFEWSAGTCESGRSDRLRKSKELFEMSHNYRWYVQKMVEQRVTREIKVRPLGRELEEILQVVRECEARWAVEDRLGDER